MRGVADSDDGFAAPLTLEMADGGFETAIRHPRSVIYQAGFSYDTVTRSRAISFHAAYAPATSRATIGRR